MKILQEIILPQINVNDEFATVITLSFKDGDRVKAGDTVIEFETSKVNVTVEAEVEGYIKYYCSEGEEIEIGNVFAVIVDCVEIHEVYDKIENDILDKKNDNEPIYSKSAISLIQKECIDLCLFKGKDFVSVHDVKKAIEPMGSKNSKDLANKKAVKSPIQTFNLENVTVEKISVSKKKEIESLSNVQAANLTSSISVYVDISGVFEGISEIVSINNSLLPVIIFEISKLLQEFRELNAYFQDDNIAYYKNINIGIAIDMGMGLKVVTIKGTNNKNIHDIEVDFLDLVNKYIDNELNIQDVSDSTFTITDLSSENVAFFSPLINSRQSAILGVSSIDKDLNRFIITLTFDHRITEGKRASEFLTRLKAKIESYSKKRSTQEKVCCKCEKRLEDEINNGKIGFLKLVASEEKNICLDCFVKLIGINNF